MAERNADTNPGAAGVTQHPVPPRPPTNNLSVAQPPMANPSSVLPYHQNAATQGQQVSSPPFVSGNTHGGMTGGNISVSTVYDAQGNPHQVVADRNGNVVSIDGKSPSAYQTPAAASRSNQTSVYGASTGPTWYEQQQIRLDEQRLADARAQQAAAEKLASSQTVEKFNTDYRDFQAKSPYGAQYGPTYFSPAGSVFAQRAPESATLKEAFANSGQPDPWASTGTVPAGYTGVSYSNPQHPGLVDFGHPTVQQDYSQQQPPANPSPAALNHSPLQIHPDFQSWHDLAHQLPQPQQQPPMAPVQIGGPSGPVTQVPSFADGGTVPGPSGSPQLIQAHAGETVIPNPSGTSSSGTDGMSGGGDWQAAFNAWHDGMHNISPKPFDMNPSAYSSPKPFVTNAYGQSVSQNTVHGAGENIVPGPMGYNPDTQKYLNNHVQYGPELSGLSGMGSLMTPNGTPVVMSNWQRQQLDPTSIANYGDYVHAIAGWSPTDMAQYSQRITGDLGNDLTRPSHWAPIGIQPSPSGG